MLESASPPIAQVHTPQGSVRYVAQARSHHGFLVQRRYRGVGEPFYRPNEVLQSGLELNHEYAEAYLEPFLNPGAVQAAGLSAGDIRQWAADHPGEVFAHPTYAPLCLRWGDNAHGYRVEEFVEPTLTPDAVPFTPHTCWVTGTTYYQWGVPLNAEEDALWEEIRVPARLRDHVREMGREGQWPGWYTTDRRALDQALAVLGRRVALAQPRTCYGVFTQDYGEIEVLMTSDTAEEARAYFTALPEAPGTFHRPAVEGAYVCFGCLVQWPGRAPEWARLCEKQVLVPEHETYFLQTRGARALPLTRMRSGELFEQDFPTGVPLVTLAAVLATTGEIRWRLAEALGWSFEELSAREQDPGRLTLAEVERIGELTHRPVGQLLMDLRFEVQARAAMAKRANARTGVRA